MPTHDITLSHIPPAELVNTDLVLDVKIDGALKGRILMSKGNVHYRPANFSARQYRISWAKLCDLITDNGQEVPI
ncbi:hypothetical protein [Caenispirillum salinarum]|uniref:hypothetical protein n=1 Tax=Caenispirillum salinarum TaxID=859058 RepID=UPI00384EF649